MPTCKNKKEREDNIKIELRKIGYEDTRWMELAQDHIQW
jgi:hypothetical protein